MAGSITFHSQHYLKGKVGILNLLQLKFLQLFSAQVERPSPEKTSTVLSTHLFLWFDKTVWKGLRRTINVEDLWDLNPSDRSAFSPNFQKAYNYIAQFGETRYVYSIYLVIQNWFSVFLKSNSNLYLHCLYIFPLYHCHKSDCLSPDLLLTHSI